MLALPVQVAAQEIAHGPTQDRMAAIASHIVGQRRCVSNQNASSLLQTPLLSCSQLAVQGCENECSFQHTWCLSCSWQQYRCK